MSSQHKRKAPSFKGYRSSSTRATKALAGSRAEDTKCERLLRRSLWHMGYRYRKNVRDLPGRPDIVFPRERVAIFCDGDFWHGRDWRGRKKRLSEGSNPTYWTAKIKANIDRDRRNTVALEGEGWSVLRLWETDILGNLQATSEQVANLLRQRRSSMMGDQLQIAHSIHLR